MVKSSIARGCSDERGRCSRGARRAARRAVEGDRHRAGHHGDIAVTLADLAQRKLLTVSETGGDGDWLLSPSAGIAPGRQQSPLLGYEKRQLDGLTDVVARSRLSALASEFGAALDDTRETLVREAVHQGWLRPMHHDQRTPKGDDLALLERSFSRELRRLKADGDKEALAGALLPYAPALWPRIRRSDAAGQVRARLGALAVLARPGFVRAAPALPAATRIRLPSVTAGCCGRPQANVSHLHTDHSASRRKRDARQSHFSGSNANLVMVTTAEAAIWPTDLRAMSGYTSLPAATMPG